MNKFEYANPYPYYHQLRSEAPVYQDRDGTWFLTRYDDVRTLLLDHRFVRFPPSAGSFFNLEGSSTPLEQVMRQWLILSDPPYHTNFRQVFSQLFDPGNIKSLQEMIESIADELLVEIMQQSRFDFMQAYSYRLPVRVINKLLGVSMDESLIRGWAIAISTALDHGSPDDFEKISPEILAMQAYFASVIDQVDQLPPSSWIAQMVGFMRQGQMTYEEVNAACIFLMIAGHETVQLTIGLGLIALFKHPDQMALLQQNPKLVAFAVEEMLRYEAAKTKLSRWSTEPMTFGQVTIPANSLIVGLVNAANRDPERFEQPDIFDIQRKNNRHLTFSYGIHTCLGALLARIELNVAFTKLLPHLHRFHLNEDSIEWLPNSAVRYLYRLMIDIKPS